jgi:cytochrome c oxidase assembly protein subunit 11
MNKQELRSSNRRIILMGGVAVVLMFGFGFAMVPLYDAFCQLTGFGGRSLNNASTTPSRVDMDREITVEFVASVGKHAYMEFRPKVAKMKIHPGEYVQTSFFAHNLNKAPITGQAIYNVAPAESSLYFHKTECFCFTEQAFKAGEEREMPLIFSISPDLPENIQTVSLSYTIYDKTPKSQVAKSTTQGD